MLVCWDLPKSDVTLCTFPLIISQASGLHLVHPTWAGTFVLAALCLVFPGLHIVLLDSDCVPVTLFEVEDLWQEAQRLQPNGFPGSATTSSCAGGLNLDPTDQTLAPKVPKEQGVILVTEHNAESMQDLWYYGVPTMLLRSLKLIGKASHLARRLAGSGSWQISAGAGVGLLATCLQNDLAQTG